LRTSEQPLISAAAVENISEFLRSTACSVGTIDDNIVKIENILASNAAAADKGKSREVKGAELGPTGSTEVDEVGDETTKESRISDNREEVEISI